MKGNTMNTDSVLLTKQLEKVQLMLKGMNCLYAIVDQNGNKHGNLEVVTPKKRQMKPDRVHGEMKAYAEKYLNGIELYELRVVPFGKYPAEDVRSACGNYLIRLHGNGTAKTYVNKELERVEVMRKEADDE